MGKHDRMDARILVAEDSFTELTRTRHALEQHGYTVSAAQDGKKALEMAKENRPDLVLSDVVMPKMGGYQLCRELKSSPDTKDVPVLLLTSLSTPKDILKGLESGADNFLIKPFKPETLVARIEDALIGKGDDELEKPVEPVSVSFGGEEFLLRSPYQKMLDFLMSTYEIALERNVELHGARDELRRLNHTLEARVEEKTSALTSEVTAHKQAEERIRILYDMIKICWRVGETLLRADNEKELFGDVADILMEGAKLKGIRIYVNEEGASRMTLVTKRGRHSCRLESTNSAEDKNSGDSIASERCPMDVAIPLVDSDVTMGTMYLCFDDEEPPGDEANQFYRDIGADIVVGLRSLRLKEKLRTTVAKLNDRVIHTAEALSKITELRDSYTARHQRRVAKLACAIATHLHMTDETITGIHVAAMLHDIGKIQIPAEILSKPSKLSDIERALMKLHPRVAHDILRGIEFPWPVAKAVLQHHEKLDGTGYPDGLEGDDIIMEARVLGVADVVEAIASHRPYRPALGIDVALEEISSGRGISYDEWVVDACLSLFQSGEFEF